MRSRSAEVNQLDRSVLLLFVTFRQITFDKIISPAIRRDALRKSDSTRFFIFSIDIGLQRTASTDDMPRSMISLCSY